ncbi:SOCS box domain-containing protein [Nephila pilipes]|uniref:SOCS box domain-containing protein n=1 Tax=Nephila pilipes TaxID=299642 RepID=A0A8X6I3U5_NEPPI|nr:SOCS box domain-containing protein [Nephila pilipes]
MDDLFVEYWQKVLINSCFFEVCFQNKYPRNLTIFLKKSEYQKLKCVRHSSFLRDDEHFIINYERRGMDFLDLATDSKSKCLFTHYFGGNFKDYQLARLYRNYLQEYPCDLFLLKFIRLAVEDSHLRFKIVIGLLKRMKNVFHENNCGIYLHLKDVFLKILYPVCTESTIIRDFLFSFNYDTNAINREENTIAEFLFHHAFVSRYYNKEERTWNINIVYNCLSNKKFEDVRRAFGYYIPSRFTPFHLERNQTIVSTIMCLSDADLLSKPFRIGLLSKERFHLMIQFFRTYFQCPVPAACQIMRLFWRAIPDAFFTFEELTLCYSYIMSPEELRRIIDFFSYVVGEEVCVSQPRTLKHLSRITVRLVMKENGQLCPENIEKLLVPLEVKSFLTLLK